MKNVCFCDETFDILVEAETSADPIWCNNCKANLDLDEFPISDGLKAELVKWNLAFGKNLGSNQYNGITKSFSNWLNTEGEKLTKKLCEELPKIYTVRYRAYTLIIEDN